MTAAQEQLYQHTLHALTAAGIPLVGLGTFALRYQCPALPRHLVADCDLQLPPDAALLTRLTALLQAAGWAVTLWEHAVTLPLCAAALTGKYYLRARRGAAILDCAYENDFLTWPEFEAASRIRHGLRWLPPAAILRQKQLANRPADLVVLRWWQRHYGPHPTS